MVETESLSETSLGGATDFRTAVDVELTLPTSYPFLTDEVLQPVQDRTWTRY